MDDGTIERIWRKAGEERPMSREEIAGLLTPRVRRSARGPNHIVWLFLGVQLAALVLASVNVPAYRANPLMLSVEVGIGVLALACAAFGIHLHGELRALEDPGVSLAETVRRRLAFYRGRWALWPWVAAVSTALLAFALTSLIDNQDGRYPIHKPAVFVGVNVAMVAVVALSVRLVLEPHERELRAVLEDVEAQLLDRTRAVDRERRRWRVLQLVLFVLLAAFAALGAWLALRSGA
jgi:hypothetical protein